MIRLCRPRYQLLLSLQKMISTVTRIDTTINRLYKHKVIQEHKHFSAKCPIRIIQEQSQFSDLHQNISNRQAIDLLLNQTEIMLKVPQYISKSSIEPTQYYIMMANIRGISTYMDIHLRNKLDPQIDLQLNPQLNSETNLQYDYEELQRIESRLSTVGSKVLESMTNNQVIESIDNMISFKIVVNFLYTLGTFKRQPQYLSILITHFNKTIGQIDITNREHIARMLSTISSMVNVALNEGIDRSQIQKMLGPDYIQLYYKINSNKTMFMDQHLELFVLQISTYLQIEPNNQQYLDLMIDIVLHYIDRHQNYDQSSVDNQVQNDKKLLIIIRCLATCYFKASDEFRIQLDQKLGEVMVNFFRERFDRSFDDMKQCFTGLLSSQNRAE